MRKWLLLGALVAHPLAVRPQASPTSLDVGVGYVRLYGADGIEFVAGISRRIGHATTPEHRVGLVFAYAHSGIASYPDRPSHTRSINGAGIQYTARFMTRGVISPLLGASVSLLHASNADVVTVVGGNATGTAIPGEDYTGISNTGWGAAVHGGVSVRLSRDVLGLATAYLERQEVYSGAVRHGVWGMLLGVRLGV